MAVIRSFKWGSSLEAITTWRLLEYSIPATLLPFDVRRNNDCLLTCCHSRSILHISANGRDHLSLSLSLSHRLLRIRELLNVHLCSNIVGMMQRTTVHPSSYSIMDHCAKSRQSFQRDLDHPNQSQVQWIDSSTGTISDRRIRCSFPPEQ